MTNPTDRTDTDNGQVDSNSNRDSTPDERQHREHRGRPDDDTALGGVFDTIPDVLYVIDEGWTLLRWNDRLCEVSGYTDAEIARMHPLEFVPKEDRDAVSRRAEAVFENGGTEAAETEMITKSGETIPFEFNGAAITNGDGEVVAMAGSAREITERVEARSRHEVSRERYRALVEAAPDAIVVADAETGEVIDANRAAESLLGRSHEEIVGLHQTELHPPGEAERYRQILEDHADSGGLQAYSEDLAVCRSDGEEVPVEISASRARLGDRSVIQGIFRDVTERRERERELEQKRRDLERLDRINAIIRRTNRALVGAVTREGIERTVCERLADSAVYAFAWISEPHPTGGTLGARAWAGNGEASVEGISIAVDEEGTGGGPTGRAIRSREVQAVRDIATDPDVEFWREAAAERGFRSSAAVPLVYDDVLYGVLNLYAERSDGFSAEERDVLGELGETIAYAINAVQSKRLLFTDRVIELEFESESAGSFFIGASGRLGATISLEGIVPSDEEADLYYMRVEGAPAEAVLALAAETPGIEGRLVSERDDESRIEFRVSSASITRSLLSQGARVKRARAENGEARIVAEVAPDTDVRTVVEGVRALFPGSELLAKREVERERRTTREFYETVTAALTDRQQAALEAAYHTGYFEWPRTSSAEEVAATMDIASPTFHQHLRAAHRKLLDVFFEE